MSQTSSSLAVSSLSLCFRNPDVQQRYVQFRTADEKFPYLLFSAVAIVYTWLTFYFLVPVFFHNDYGTIGIITAIAGCFHWCFVVLILLMRLGSIDKKYALVASYHRLRIVVENLCFIFCPLSCGMILYAKSHFGGCTPEMSLFEQNWCNTMAASDMIPVDVVSNMIIMIGFEQSVLRGSHWFVALASYLVGFVFIVLGIIVTGKYNHIQYIILVGYLVFFYFLYIQERSVLSKFITHFNKLTDDAMIATNSTQDARFHLEDIMDFGNVDIMNISNRNRPNGEIPQAEMISVDGSSREFDSHTRKMDNDDSWK